MTNILRNAVTIHSELWRELYLIVIARRFNIYVGSLVLIRTQLVVKVQSLGL